MISMNEWTVNLSYEYAFTFVRSPFLVRLLSPFFVLSIVALGLVILVVCSCVFWLLRAPFPFLPCNDQSNDPAYKSFLYKQ